MVTVTLNQLIEIYNALLSGKLSRREADRWAWEMMQHEDHRNLVYEPAEQEDLIWELLYNLFGCDERCIEDRNRMIWTNEDLVGFLTETGFTVQNGQIVPEKIHYEPKKHLKRITDLFDHDITTVFRVINSSDTIDPAEYLIEHTDYALIPDEQGGYFFIKALRISASGVENCFMDMQIDGRKAKWVVRRKNGRIVVEEIALQTAASVIPAIASEQYGNNTDLYFAEENPWEGIHVLKCGLHIARNKNAVKNDLYALKNRIKELQKTSEITKMASLWQKSNLRKKR